MIADANEQIMGELTHMIQASVQEETMVPVDQIGAVRRKRDLRIEQRFQRAEEEVAAKKEQLEEVRELKIA